MATRKELKSTEYGDFQTPLTLAEEAVRSLSRYLSFKPRTIIEPTCGAGAFFTVSAEIFPDAEKIIGIDIDNSYLENLRRTISTESYNDRVQIIHADFFNVDWDGFIADLPPPILFVGNPPWVTSADIGTLQGSNLPPKTNFQNHKGFDAVTGKANFDISEWMLIQLVNMLRDRQGCVAMLCKTAVARKILIHCWKAGSPFVTSRMVQVDAMHHFRAAVDACFFVVESNQNFECTECDFYESFDDKKPSQKLGYHDGTVFSDMRVFRQHRNLLGNDRNYVWRSGVKHDCSKIMELRQRNGGLENAAGENVDIEPDFLFPLLKSSDLANGRVDSARLKVIVTQRRVGEDTAHIKNVAPCTWNYLERNRELLDKRSSRVYLNKPTFAIFGIGDYAFSSWKVAISGFYKSLEFQVVGPIDGKPTMLDDTAYFLSCVSREEAHFIADILNSNVANALLSSMIFWTDKRPITIRLLQRLDIGKVADRMNRGAEYQKFVSRRQSALPIHSNQMEQTIISEDQAVA